MTNNNTKKHHFIHQEYLRNVFKREKFDVWILDKYIDDKKSKDKLDLSKYKVDLDTSKIFNSNYLLDNDSDENYWQNIEKNTFLRKNLPLLYSNDIKSLTENMKSNQSEIIDWVSYISKLAIRNSHQYWDACHAIISESENEIEINLLRVRINEYLINKHKKLINLWLANKDKDNLLMLKTGFLNLGEEIAIIGESSAICFDTLGNNTKAEFIMDISILLKKKMQAQCEVNIIVEKITEILELAMILPFKNGLIYLKNNYKNLNIENNFLFCFLHTFYTDGYYFKYCLMTSLNQVVIINEKKAQEFYICLENNKEIEKFINEERELYKLYKAHHRNFRKV